MSIQVGVPAGEYRLVDKISAVGSDTLAGSLDCGRCGAPLPSSC